MARVFTEAEMELIKKNPNVFDVNPKRIAYANEFKMHFIEEYNSGKGPTTIFREAGFDTALLGAKRIERAAAKWKAAYAKNGKFRQGSLVRHTNLPKNPRKKKEDK